MFLIFRAIVRAIETRYSTVLLEDNAVRFIMEYLSRDTRDVRDEEASRLRFHFSFFQLRARTETRTQSGNTNACISRTTIPPFRERAAFARWLRKDGEMGVRRPDAPKY